MTFYKSVFASRRRQNRYRSDAEPADFVRF